MTGLLLAAPILLTLTLLTSGLAKLGARRGTEDAMTSLRLPLRSAHRSVATVLPVAEIVLALVLWVPLVPLQVLAAVVIALLMLAYLVIVARALSWDEQVECSCFGTLASPTVSRTTLGRNLLLVVLSGLGVVAAASGLMERVLVQSPLTLIGLGTALLMAIVLTALAIGTTDPAPGRDAAADGTSSRSTAAGGPSARAAATAGSTAAGGTAAGSTAADGGTVAGTTASGTAVDGTTASATTAGSGAGSAQDASVEDGASGTPEGEEEVLDYERAPIPAGVLQQSDDRLVTLRQLTAQRAVLLVFVTEGCGPCERVLDHAPAWIEELSAFLEVRFVFSRRLEDLRERTVQRVGAHALHDLQFTARTALGGRTAPGAVLMGADGMLAGGPVDGGTAVIEFVQEIQEQLSIAQQEGEIAAPGQ